MGVTGWSIRIGWRWQIAACAVEDPGGSCNQSREDLEGSLGWCELLKDYFCSTRLVCFSPFVQFEVRLLSGHVEWKRFRHFDLVREIIDLPPYTTCTSLVCNLKSTWINPSKIKLMKQHPTATKSIPRITCTQIAWGCGISQAPTSSYEDPTTRNSLLIWKQKSCCK